MAAAAPADTPKSLYVGDLSPDVSEGLLYDTFNCIGPVGSVRICRDTVSRKSLGYGYVNYIDAQHAEKAIDQLNYTEIKGRSCRIMFVEKDASKRADPKGNIHIQNLASKIDNKTLHDTFKQFGRIISCKVATNPAGDSLGYGFVHFQENDNAQEAIKQVHGKEIEGNIVSVTEHKPVDKGSSEVDTFNNLYVKNFPNDWDEAKVRETFEPHGTISSMCVMDDTKNRKFAFVSFQTHDAAKAAIAALHEKDFRTEDEKKADEEAGKEMKPEDLFYVQRHQTKLERRREALKTWTAEGALKAQSKGNFQGRDDKGKGKGKGKSKGKGKGKSGPAGQNTMPMNPMMNQQNPMMMNPQMAQMAQMNPQMAQMAQMAQMMQGKGMPMNPMMMNPQMMGKGMPMMPGMMMPGMMPTNAGNKGQLSFADKVNSAAPDKQKQLLGERLYPQISKIQPELAGKITGMLLEMDNPELLALVSNKTMLNNKVTEAMAVLKPKA